MNSLVKLFVETRKPMKMFCLNNARFMKTKTKQSHVHVMFKLSFKINKCLCLINVFDFNRRVDV